MFVMSSEKLNNYRNNIEFFMSPDVFILGNDLYRDVENKEIKNLVYPDNGNCQLQISTLKINDLEIYKYNVNPNFILCLINANDYHKKHNSEIYFNIPIKHSKITYIKIVYPFCEGN